MHDTSIELICLMQEEHVLTNLVTRPSILFNSLLKIVYSLTISFETVMNVIEDVFLHLEQIGDWLNIFRFQMLMSSVMDVDVDSTFLTPWRSPKLFSV